MTGIPESQDSHSVMSSGAGVECPRRSPPGGGPGPETGRGATKAPSGFPSAWGGSAPHRCSDFHLSSDISKVPSGSKTP